MKKILAAYGFWAAGVLTAVAAAWLLYRSRVLTGELAGDELELGLEEPDGWNVS